MAKPKIEWNLAKHGGDGIISTVETKVSIPKEKGSKEKIEGTTTTVGRILNLESFRAAIEAAINKGKDEKEHVSLTHSYLLQEFVNDSVIANYRQYLRVKANPDATVKNAIVGLKKKFANLSDEQAEAMAKMLLAAIKG